METGQCVISLINLQSYPPSPERHQAHHWTQKEVSLLDVTGKKYLDEKKDISVSFNLKIRQKEQLTLYINDKLITTDLEVYHSFYWHKILQCLNY